MIGLGTKKVEVWCIEPQLEKKYGARTRVTGRITRLLCTLSQYNERNERTAMKVKAVFSESLRKTYVMIHVIITVPDAKDLSCVRQAKNLSLHELTHY